MVYILSVYKNAGWDDLAKVEDLLQGGSKYPKDGMFGIDSFGEVKWLVTHWLCAKQEDRYLFQGKDIEKRSAWMAYCYPGSFKDDLRGYKGYLQELGRINGPKSGLYQEALIKAFVVLKGHKYLIESVSKRGDLVACKATMELENRMPLVETNEVIQHCINAFSHCSDPNPENSQVVKEKLILDAAEASDAVRFCIREEGAMSKDAFFIKDKVKKLMVKITFAFGLGFLVGTAIKAVINPEEEVMPAKVLKPSLGCIGAICCKLMPDPPGGCEYSGPQ